VAPVHLSHDFRNLAKLGGGNQYRLAGRWRNYKPHSNERGRDMPTDFRRPRKREPTDLERYGHWQDGVMLIALVLLGTLIANWFWGG
jgi:hypothetical protein